MARAFRTPVIICVLLLFIGLIFSISSNKISAAEAYGSISGHVYRFDGITPVADARVCANSVVTGGGPAAYTSQDGSYTIPGLPSGNYTVYVQASGYVTEYYNGNYNGKQSTPVSVAAPGDTSGIDFSLDAGGSISGHVYQSDGITPVSGAHLSASVMDTDFWYSMDAVTGADGSYTIGTLISGSYRVEAYNTGYIREYYRDTYSYTAVMPVVVILPNNTPGIDFTLDAGGSISGFVFKADGSTPLAGAYVNAELTGSDYYYSGGAPAEQDGSYTITGLPSGSYMVYAHLQNYITEFYGGTYQRYQATIVSVVATANTTGINISMDASGFISGHVYKADGITPVTDVQVYATPIETGVGSDTRASPDGSYTISGLPFGSYWVYVVASGYINEYYNGAYNQSEAAPVIVTAPNNTPDIDFTLDTGGRISGHVYKSDGTTPIAGANVIAQTQGGVYYGKNAYTAADGSYTISGLVTGSYMVYTQAQGYIWECYNGTYYGSEATPVAVTVPDETQGIDFTLDIGGTISGHVYKNDGVTPIANANVNAEMVGTSHSFGGYAWSASDGSYTIMGLPSGSYRVNAGAQNYLQKHYNGTYDANAATPVTVTVPGNTPDINFSLDTGGTISGHVYKADGTTPLAGIRVWSYNKSTPGWKDYVLTDATGAYTLRGLYPGGYYARAEDSSGSTDYINEFYNNVHSFNLAETINVTVNHDTSGINFTMDIGGSISGHVYKSDGVTPIANASVGIKDWPDPMMKPSVSSDAAGYYIIRGLPVGSYLVRAISNSQDYISEWYDSKLWENEATPVSVTVPNDTPNINFTLDVGGTISGHVYKADGITPISNAHVYAEQVGYYNYYSGGAKTASDGSYVIKALPSGSYRVGVNAPGYVGEFYNGVYYSYNASQVNVTAPNDTSGINFTLDTGGTISGHVYKTDGTTAISGAYVYAEPVDGGYSQSATTGGDGSYTISSLPPGTYRVVARATDFVPEYYNNVFRSSEATPVPVADSADTPNVNFSLDTGGSISGHVYQADGTTPVAGAYLSASLADYGYVSSAASGADGSYVIRGLLSGSYQVRAEAQGYVPEYYNGTYYSGDSVSVTVPNDTPNINFTLDSGGSISGHVYKADGTTPVAGAIINAWNDSTNSYGADTISAADGSYTVRTLPSGNYMVRAYASGFLTEYFDSTYSYNAATMVTVTAPSDTPNINFTLDAGGSISGHVYKPDGTTPVAGANLYAELTGADYGYGSQATTSADGSYTIRTLPTGSFRVRVEAAGYIREYYVDTYNYSAATLVSVTVPNDTPNINFTLDTGGSISGHVYKADGTTPVSGAYVYADLMATDYGYSSGAATNSDGSYTIRALPTGSFRVRAEATGFLAEYYNDTYFYYASTLVTVTTPNDTPNINFTLDTGGSISGHVYQADGATPVAGANLYAELTGADYGYGAQATTSANGSYALRTLPTGSYKIRSEATGFITEYYNGTYNSNAATPVTVTSPNDTPNINFMMDTGGSISGHVYQVDGTTPVSGASLYALLTGADYSYHTQATSEADGSYIIRTLPGGSYTVRANATGFLTEYYDGTYVDSNATLVYVTMHNDTPNINFTLDTGGSISGHVYRADGTTPVAGAYIDARITGEPAGYFYGNNATTAEDGSYKIPALLSGNYTLKIRASGFLSEYYDSTYISGNATLVSVTMPNDTPNINFTLDTGGSISGHVYQADGSTPVAGARVYAQITGDAAMYFSGNITTTASDGSYTVPTLLAGSYTVSVSASGFIPEYYDGKYNPAESTLVSVTMPGDTPNINFTLDTGGTISGHIYKTGGTTPLADVRVYAELAAAGYRYSAYATSTADGSYIVRALPSGKYILSASASGYLNEYYNGTYDSTAVIPVTVTAPGDTPNINFVLDAGGTISGHVYKADGTTPVAGANIIAEPADGQYKGAGAYSTGDGSYTITRVYPGRYRVRAIAGGFIGELYSGTYDANTATIVTVAESSSITDINFTLETGGSISGHVYKPDGVTPVYQAYVSASSLQGNNSGSGYTSADGSYTIPALPSGSYRVQVQASGYPRDLYYSHTYKYSEATPVAVTAPDDTPDINFTLDNGGSISGHVYQSDGTTPVPSAYVTVFLVEGLMTYSSYYGYPTGDGSYTITGLPAGSYRVSASAPGYITQYYNGVSSTGSATLVTVTDSVGTPGIDFKLDSGGSISGHVYKADGVTPIYNAYVSTQPSYSGGVYTAQDGSYSLKGLSSGKYRVYAYASGCVSEYFNSAYYSTTVTMVSVTAPGDTPSIDFSLDLSGSILGYVFKADGVTPVTSGVKVNAIPLATGQRPPSGAEPKPAPAPAPAPPPTTTVPPAQTVTPTPTATPSPVPTPVPPQPMPPTPVSSLSIDGSYKITGLPPGQYRLFADSASYVKEYYNGAYFPANATLVTVSSASDTPNINFTLDNGGSIIGHVFKADGVTPVSGANVTANLVEGGYSRSAATGLDGSYTIPALISGKYIMSCSITGYAPEYFDSVFSPVVATPVSVVAPNLTLNVNFTLDSGGSISGYVRLPDGTAPLKPEVRAYDAVTGRLVKSTGADTSGQYRITNLPAGSYLVRASSYVPNYIGEWYNNVYSRKQAAPVSVVNGGETANINFSIDAGGTISGFVYQSDNNAPVYQKAMVRVFGADGSLYAESSVASDGSYRTGGLPAGAYTLRAEALGYASQWYENTPNSGQARAVTVVVPNDTPNINFGLSLDNTPPAVTAASPAGSTVSLGSIIQVNFSKAMDTATVELAFLMTPPVMGRFSWSGNTMTFAPASPLAYQKTYVVVIGAGARDLAGNSLPVAFTWKFSTPELYTLTIASTGNGTVNPANGAYTYPVNTVVNIAAAPSEGWQFSGWSGHVADTTSASTTVTMDGSKVVTANFIRTITSIGAIIENLQAFEGKTVLIRGEYRGTEAGHGSPPVSRSDSVVQDSTGYIWVTGKLDGYKYPADVGKPISLSGVVKSKNGKPYIELVSQVIF